MVGAGQKSGLDPTVGVRQPRPRSACPLGGGPPRRVLPGWVTGGGRGAIASATPPVPGSCRDRHPVEAPSAPWTVPRGPRTRQRHPREDVRPESGWLSFLSPLIRSRVGSRAPVRALKVGRHPPFQTRPTPLDPRRVVRYRTRSREPKDSKSKGGGTTEVLGRSRS